MDRRSLLASLALASWAHPALANDNLNYRGFTVDTTEAPEHNGYLAVESLKRQIDIIVDSGVKPEILDFFHTVPIAMRGALKSGYRVGLQIGLELAPIVWEGTAPVMLRGLLVPYFNRALPTQARAALAPFYAEARRIAAAQRAFPYLDAGSLQTPASFFAQTASLYLCGTAESPPFERRVLKQKQPDYCDWLGQTLGVNK
jgi:hypothetical protein